VRRRAFFVFFIIAVIVINFTLTPVIVLADGEDDAIEAFQNIDATSIKAKSFILMDAKSGRVILDNNSHDRLSIASVTKIMTMLLIMEALDAGRISLKDKVLVSENSFRAGKGTSSVFLEPGEEFSVEGMLKAIAIASANDAAVAMAEKIAGSEEAFVALMNKRAKELNMKDTNFLDCTGLTDEGHYSSAFDVGIMSRELLTKYPQITKYSAVWMDTFEDGVTSLTNTNKLVRYYDGCIGLKTGYTQKAGHNLSAAAARNNLTLISVVLGEPDKDIRFADSKRLLNFGFANYEQLKANSKNEVIGEIEVKKCVKNTVRAVCRDDVVLLIEKGTGDKITRRVMLEERLIAPVKEGQRVGRIVYLQGDTEIGGVDLVADSNADKATFLRLYIEMIMKWFGIGRQ